MHQGVDTLHPRSVALTESAVAQKRMDATPHEYPLDLVITH